MPTEKDTKTELFRQRLSRLGGVVETDRADSGLSTLSFQSVMHPQRHVWIDTDLAGECILDLEDWIAEETWDNSVAHLASQDVDTVTVIANAWLTGATVEECKRLGGSVIDLR